MSEIPGIEGSSLHKFLLGPFYLFEDVLGALVPGIVFLLLLLLKKVPAVTSAIATPYLGYKTKLVAGVLLGYVVGTIFQIPSRITLNLIEAFGPSESWVVSKVNESGSLSDLLRGRGRDVLVGFLVGLFLPPFEAFDLRAVERGQVSFYISTGLALVTASFLPGDGFLGFERWGGVALVMVGVAGLVKVRKNSALLLGLGIANAVINGPKDYEQRVAGAFRLLFGKSISSLRAEFLGQSTAKAKEEPPVGATDASG